MIAVPIDLSSYYNFVGITEDGHTFSGGMDGSSAYASALLGSSVTYNGNTYNFGPTDSENNEDNCIQFGDDFSISLSGSYSSLVLLMCAVDGNKEDLTFIINYTDSTNDTINQSISDWASPQGYDGEANAIGPMDYRDVNDGSTQEGTFYLYAYTIPINSGKVLSSISMPNNSEVFLFAASCISPSIILSLSGIPSVEADGDGSIFHAYGLTGISSSEVFGTGNAGEFFHLSYHCFNSQTNFENTCPKNSAFVPAITIASNPNLMKYYVKYVKKDTNGLYVEFPF